MSLYCVYMQIALKHQKIKLKRKPEELNWDYKPFVSIMIPAHNEQDVIEKTVENILALDYEKYEVVLIDYRSEDNTAEKLAENLKKNKKIKQNTCFLT